MFFGTDWFAGKLRFKVIDAGLECCDSFLGSHAKTVVAIQTMPDRPLDLVVVLAAEVSDLVFAHHPAQRVLELALLYEQVVLGV